MEAVCLSEDGKKQLALATGKRDFREGLNQLIGQWGEAVFCLRVCQVKLLLSNPGAVAIKCKLFTDCCQ